MRVTPVVVVVSCAVIAGSIGAIAQSQAPPAAAQAAQTPAAADDPVRTLVGRLDLEKYKATVKGLTQFGDRRQGTKRNRDAVDWIEAQLKSYGCTNTERVKYQYPAARAGGAGGNAARGGGGAAGGATGAAAGGAAGAAAGGAAGAGGGRAAGAGAGAAGAAGGDVGAGDAAGARGAGGQRGGGRGAVPQGTPVRTGPGGSTEFGFRGPTGVYQPDRGNALPLDPRLRELNAEPAVNGLREEVFCTKVGTTHPEEMYIVGGHMDGHGWGEAANDDGSGTALVMELARVFSSPDVQTERTIRFVLWNNEETGTNGARAYIDQRQSLQGIEDPKGSGKYPEPKWLGMIQHDMMMWDHGMPQAQKDKDGNTIYVAPKEQRPEADVNIEFLSTSKMAEGAMKLAWLFRAANDKYATDYPAAVGPHMTNTDSGPFQDLVASISLRENERGMHIQAGWDPNWHQPSDVFTTYSDKDFRLGLNAAQTTLAAVAQLTGMKLAK
jgi:hypothetical protein